MKSDIKALWLNALRSGTYTKGEGSLYFRDTDGTECHCALGVLAEEAAKAGVIEIDPAQRNNDRYPEAGSYHYLPDAVLEWAGFPLGDEKNVAMAEAKVVRQNDTAKGEDCGKTTFKQVADFIETEL